MNEHGARYVEVCSTFLIALLATLVPLPSAAQVLPSGWTATNIANPTLAGSAVYSNGVFSVSGAGTQIWGTTDQFIFVSRQLSGDGVVVARVSGLVGASGWSSAGLMIRESLLANSKNTTALVSASDGLNFQWRPTTGGITSSTSAGSGAAPVWLKLQRQASTFRAFRSADGLQWTGIGSVTITMLNTVYVGLAVSSYYPTKLALSTFSSVSVGAASTAPPESPTPPPTSNKPPAVSLTSPVSGASYPVPATISLAATATDSDGSVARVDFYAGSVLIGSDTSSPYGAVWSNVAAGTYPLTAIARDNVGAVTTSAASTVTVSTNRPPVVSMTAPTSGATFKAPASIGLAATASDPDGTVSNVDFYNGSTLIGSDTGSPYAITWGNVAVGKYSLTAVARDNAGGMTVSGALGVLVVNPLMPKHLLFTPSTNSAAVNSYTLDIFTAGSNPATASPIATQGLGKPPVVNGQCDVDIAQTVFSLPTGTYFATVTAVGSGGIARSAPSAPFSR